MNWQLIAHHDDEVRELVFKILRKALDPARAAVRPIDAPHIARAEQVVEDFGADQCSLVVIGSTMPQSAEASVGLSGREPTKQFIKRLKAHSSRMPVIVIASTPDDRLADFLDAYDRTALVTIDADFGKNLLDRILQLRADEGRHGSARLKLDIHLCDERTATWQLRRSRGDNFEASGTLQLDADLLKRVIHDSGRLDRDVAQRSSDWLASLDRLSGDLRKLLFTGGTPNFGCWERFIVHRERVGGIPHTRVRVTVNQQTHPVLVEALKDEEAAAGDYWMLRAPVFRRYAHPTAYPPLFKDPDSRLGRVNCLIIEADGEPGNVPDAPGGARSFDRLSHSADESRAITDTLTLANCHVDTVRIGDLGDQVVDQVMARLGERQWHIVHFCGHVSGGASDDAGLVLRADRGGILPVKAMVRQLGRTQLLFLSSCRSASAKIAMSAVEQHVPALLGFQWVVDDQGASAFARAFYRLLFDPSETCHRYLEYAFMKARKAVYDQRPQDPSWVAPVLVMQMD